MHTTPAEQCVLLQLQDRRREAAASQLVARLARARRWQRRADAAARRARSTERRAWTTRQQAVAALATAR